MSDTATVDEAQVAEEESSAASSSSGGVPRVAGLWLGPPSRRRLLDQDIELLDEDETGADLILVSTRAPIGSSEQVAQLVATGTPVVVVCHPGGEDRAVKYVGLGARTIVAEGAEQAALGLLDGGSSTQMVGSYRAQVDASYANGSEADPVSGLPGQSAFDDFLAEVFEAGTIPTLGLIDLGLGTRRSALGVSTVNGIRRRFSSSLLDLALHRDARIFDLDNGLVAFVSAGMATEATPAFAQAVLQLGRMFRPSGFPLDVAIGTACPETAGDPDELLALAERALDVARNLKERTIDADALGNQGTAALELEAALHVADAVDSLDPRGPHQSRVADLAVVLARHLEIDPATVAAIGLAARLHDSGKVAFGADAFDETADRYEESDRTHPETGAVFVSLAAGDEVASFIRGHHERWDGEGHPEGLAGADIPLGARLVAVVDRLDDLRSTSDPLTDLAALLREESGSILDPELVEAAIEAFNL